MKTIMRPSDEDSINDCDTTRRDIYRPKYDENRNLKCSRTLKDDDEDNAHDTDKHAASVKKIIPGFLRKLRSSKRYKK